MSKILLIEDEANVSSFIKTGLEEEGFAVDVAFDGLSGLEFAQKNEYSLIILDIIMPKMTGIEVCKKIREQKGFSIPILMLTALGSTEDIVKGLETGADDYQTKPFRFKELLARVNALLRRQTDVPAPKKVLKFADLELDTETLGVIRAGQKITLTSKEFRLLEYFMNNPNKVLSRTQILEKVWDIKFDLGTNVVDVYVNYLRNKIDKNFPTKLIHTVVGAGYAMKLD